MQTYRGSCHCGRITFEVDANITSVADCNCSLCRRKGALYHRVEPEHFRILSGDETLSVYEFNTRATKHYFCKYGKYGGIHPFHRPRAAPEKWGVNVRCLANLDLAQIEILPFDGKN